MSHQIIFTDSLSHHGIKGQRWGVRRYRNEDGSLTDAGKRRYETDKKNNKKHKLSTKQKVTIGVAAGTTALAVIGGIAYSKYIKSKAGEMAKAKGKAIFDRTLATTPHTPTPAGFGFLNSQASTSAGQFYSRQTMSNKKTGNARKFVKSTKKEIKSNTDMGKRIKYYLEHPNEGIGLYKLK